MPATTFLVFSYMAITPPDVPVPLYESTTYMTFEPGSTDKISGNPDAPYIDK